MRLFKSFFAVLLICGIPQAMAGASEHLETIKNNPEALYSFFKAMPKGGELHYHFSGGSYAETMLELAKTRDDYCLDPNTSTISQTHDHCNGTILPELNKNTSLYNQTITAWSMKNFNPSHESGHDHFFNAFAKFGPTVDDFSSQLLADILQRAAAQHVHYMELITFYNNNAENDAKLIQSSTSWAEKQKILLNSPLFQNHINQTIQASTHLLTTTRHQLGCDLNPKLPACTITVKFQYFVMRNNSKDNVFAQALAGFVAASRAPNIVAVNLVQAEDDTIALRDYQTHMNLFAFLHAKYPTVHISLHAGELTPQTTKAFDLGFHIKDAIFTGHAERIGHGVDITHEKGNLFLLNYMAKHHIAVEINLISNQAILAIFGKQHPLNLYLKHHVPVVLSTDDEGILRTDLTHQYVDAVKNHHLNYATIKQINRNALTYSFLPGKSIWSDATNQIAVPECQSFTSKRCKHFISHNKKAHLQWQLEQELTHFEAQWSKKT